LLLTPLWHGSWLVVGQMARFYSTTHQRRLDIVRGERFQRKSTISREDCVPVVVIIRYKMQQNSDDSQHKTQQKPVESAARNMLSIQSLQEHKNATINHWIGTIEMAQNNM
jgi:hypothetical protein